MAKFFVRIAGICLLNAGILPLTSQAQLCNLIPNGDFEQVSGPGSGGGNNLGSLTNWSALNTPDYYTFDLSTPGPYNTGEGAVTPHSGRAVVGLFTSFYGGQDYTLAGPTEYITTQISALQCGKYYAAFYALRPASPNAPTSIGITVGANAPTLSADYTFTASSGVQRNFSATDIWTRVSGTFDAVGGEQFVTIGNLNAQRIYNAPVGTGGAYYFIDDVALYRLPQASASCGTATVAVGCDGNVVLGTGCPYIPGVTYQWLMGPSQTPVAGANQATLTVSPSATTTYTLRVILPDAGVPPYETSVTVVPAPAPVANGNVSVCSGQASVLSPNCQSRYYTYQWLEGPSYTNVISTNYTVAVAPSQTTTYKLRITPVDQLTNPTESLVTVTVLPVPVAPQLTVLKQDDCLKTVQYQITNYNAAFTYSVGFTVGLNLVQFTQDKLLFQSTGGTSGNFSLQAANSCDARIAYPSVVFGAPTTPPAPVLGPGKSVACFDNSQYFIITNFDPMLTYTVRAFGASAIPSRLGYIPATSTSPSNTIRNPEFRIKGGAGSTGAYFTITAANQCGLATPVQDPGDEYDATFPQCPSAAPANASYELYPNPATDEVVVNQSHAMGSKEPAAFAKSDELQVQIIDSFGQLRLKKNGYESASVRLQVSQLPAGLYIVRIVKGDELVSSQRLQINK